MSEPLNLFPNRAAIGRADDRGDVYMTPEFARALAALLTRVGGPMGDGMDDLATELATSASTTGLHLAAVVEGLERQIAQATELAATLGELRKSLADLEAAGGQVAPPTDWEHPGKLGAQTPNSAAFTDATARTLNKLTFTQPAAAATLTLDNNKTFRVANTLTLTSVDGATLNIVNGGTLGSAAYQDANAFAIRSTTALGAAATDATTTQTLVNKLRSVLLTVGIGT